MDTTHFKIRLPWLFVPILMGLVYTSTARDFFLARGAQKKTWTISSNYVSQTTVTLNFGDLELRYLAAPNWVENPMMLRPQLMIFRCGPLSSPSTIHLEVLGNMPHSDDRGMYVSLMDPTFVAQKYVHKQWIPSTNAPPIPGLTWNGFQRVDFKDTVADNSYVKADPSAFPLPKTYREEIHIFGTNNVGIRMRMVLSSELKAEDEAAIRNTLANMVFSFPPPKR